MAHRAGFWIRVLATMIDGFVLLGLAIAYYSVFAVTWELTYDEHGSQMIAGAMLYGGWLLYTSLEIWTAATLGKLAIGLRIRQPDCSPADRWRLFLRWQTKQYPVICALLFVVGAGPAFYALGGFMNLIVFIGCLYASNDDHLAWHDQWAGTAVCWKQKAVAVTAPPPLPALR